MSKIMDFGNLLNHNIRVERHVEQILNKECEVIKLVNTTNDMILAEFSSVSPILTWLNPGGFMNRKEYDKVIEELKTANVR